MRAKDLKNLLDQLTTLLDAGVPIRQALAGLSRGSHGPVAGLASRLDAALGEGDTLARALGRPPPALPPELIAVVEAGEVSGKLPTVLRRLGDELERRRQLRGALLRRSAYPLLVVLLAMTAGPLPILVLDGLLAYLVAVAQLFLPLALLGASGVVVWRVTSRIPGIRRAVEAALVAVPWLGPTVFRLALGRTLSLLGVLLEAGLGLRQALDLTADTTRFERLSFGFREAGAALERGADFSESLHSVKDVPPAHRMAIASGETAGALDQALQRVGQELVDGAWHGIEVAARVLPVVAYIAAGIIVFLHALSVFTAAGLAR